MTDVFDQATFVEERERELSIRAARNAPQRDFEAEVCNGCDFVTKACYGKSCDVFRECLADLQKREAAACRG